MQRGRTSPFDLGSAWKNFLEVFGANPLLWALPIFSSRGDGLSFHTDLAAGERRADPHQNEEASEEKPLLEP